VKGNKDCQGLGAGDVGERNEGAELIGN